MLYSAFPKPAKCRFLFVFFKNCLTVVYCNLRLLGAYFSPLGAQNPLIFTPAPTFVPPLNTEDFGHAALNHETH